MDFLIIDNGKTLTTQDSPHIKVFPNKNYGGSGGFTRGMMEAVKKGGYTHVLLMDDDISFEPEVFIKTIRILQYTKKSNTPLWVGGQMLMEDSPQLQYESGACFKNGRIIGFGRNLDLSQEQNLFENEKEKEVQYNAWWYCCIPIECIHNSGLPLPFFIKADDIEYGLRINPEILLMNGIGVWHTDFSQKYSPYLEYYIKRNELIVSALYQNGNGSLAGIKKLIRSAGKAILIGDPKTVKFLLLAYEDYLKGPDFFLDLDDEKNHLNLLKQNKEKPKSRIKSFLTDPFRVFWMCCKFLFSYWKVEKKYLDGISKLTSWDFWRRRLEIEK